MNIQVAIQDFLMSHEIMKSSVHTIRNYGRSLYRFAKWVLTTHDIADTDDLQVMHLRGWVSALQKTPARHGKGELLSDSTVHAYGLHLMIFCHWLEYEEVIEKPITTRFKLPHVEQKFIPTFIPDDVEKLLAACNEGDKRRPQLAKALTARNRAIVSILVDAGLRRKEIVGLRLCDVDRDLRLLVVHRKGNKWQQVPISREGFKSLHEYLTKHRPYLAKLGGNTRARKEDAVFLSYEGEPLTFAGIAKLFERLHKRTGIDDKRVSAHQCRRYMATTQLEDGRSPLDVQRQMGHTTLIMTNRYASLTTNHLRRSHEEHSPLRIKKELFEMHGIGTGYWEE